MKTMPKVPSHTFGSFMRPFLKPLLQTNSSSLHRPLARRMLRCSSILYDRRIATTPSPTTPASQSRTAPLPSQHPHNHHHHSNIHSEISHLSSNNINGMDQWKEDDPISETEMNRRRKISSANKGRVPWNKGRSLSDDVRARIRQKTFEAMQRPDVRARMLEANQNRPPHREEVKDKIRSVLRERVQFSRKIIADQTQLIIESMKHSEIELERDTADHPKTGEIIGKAAWHYLRRDFETLHIRWESNQMGFRDQVLTKLQELRARESRRRGRPMAGGSDGSRSNRRLSKTPNAKVRSAMATQKKLQDANEKLMQVEAVLAKLQAVKEEYAAKNPQALKLVEEKESQTLAVFAKLKEQVSLLQDAMSPLQEYLVPHGSSAMEFVVQQQRQAEAEENVVNKKAVGTPPS